MTVRIETQSEPIPGYKLLDRLGSGGFGEVWRCEAPGGIFKAIKIVHGDLRCKDNDLVRYAEQELKALKRVKMVRHPYLLALDRYDIVDGRLLITMELADCNLWDRFRECRDKGLPGIPRDELMLYMSETAEVLDLMNDQHQLQHLDIKPQNLFMLHNHVKVADFGQVKDLENFAASVTGGITPVYAAPETFDGLVSKYCDQYSLACVYQELLTGQRPFDGTSMSQLLMQHIQLAPDLNPSPACDRPALARALAKKPGDRWPTAAAFVKALREAGTARTNFNDAPTVFPAGDTRSEVAHYTPPAETPRPAADELDAGPVYTPAPPEVAGPGVLQPVLLIGIGQTGLRVLQRFRFDTTELFGPPEGTPLVRTLYIDTDPDSLDDAAIARPLERLAGLGATEIVGAKLNRAGHYLKPRFNGRSLTEGWFDPQLLYKLPRTPHTLGLRLFGRLAFCDHYRAVAGKIQVELEAALAPENLFITERRTGLERRTNRPRVVVVAGLSGGTGGGMFIDVAYAVRTRLQRMGYEFPEVVGLLVAPPADPTLTPPQALGNTYAAITELNHYSRPET
ncbi:MAG TPA: tubulin-like doman-containing protein, partial [Gemmataceae bacterium]|nr:tubulin-like doman-containing protein [Gemmataceae bacterium]